MKKNESEDALSKAENERSCVLVLGMHRSGTSALTKLFNFLGCDLPQTLMNANASNETGHWESTAIQDINDEVLASAGSRWDDWLSFNPGWYSSPAYPEYKKKALDILREEFGDSRLFVLKDPRICRLVPFWLDVLKSAGVRPLIFMPVRNPLEVAASLFTRNSIDPALGHLLWLRHILDSEVSTRGLDRFHCTYEGLLKEWPSLVECSEKALGMKWPRMSVSVQDEIESFLTSRLRHHNAPAEDIYDNPTYSNWLKQVFEIINRWSSEGENSDDYTALDAIHAEIEAVAPAFFRLVSAGQDAVHKNRLYKELEEETKARIAQLEEALVDKDKAIDEKNSEIAGTKQLVESVNTKLVGISKEKAKVDGQLKQCFSEMAVLSRILKEKESFIERQALFREILVSILSIRPADSFFARLKALFTIPFHFALIDKRLKQSGLFDADKYICLYPDVAKAKLDPLWHYVRYGFIEGRESGMPPVSKGTK